MFSGLVKTIFSCIVLTPPCPDSPLESTPDQLAAPSDLPAPSDSPKRPALVLLVRHAATPSTGRILPGRAPGLSLSETGLKQAAAVAARIATLSVAAVYTSPMERARETAEPIARAVGCPVTAVEGLNECDFGEWTGRPLAELFKLEEWKSVRRRPSRFRFPGGESFVEMQERVCEAVETLARGHGGETIVAVSHADPIKAVAAHVVGMRLDDFQRLVVGTASVTALVLADEFPLLLTLNSMGENLEALQPQ